MLKKIEISFVKVFVVIGYFLFWVVFEYFFTLWEILL